MGTDLHDSHLLLDSGTGTSLCWRWSPLGGELTVSKVSFHGPECMVGKGQVFKNHVHSAETPDTAPQQLIYGILDLEKKGFKRCNMKLYGAPVSWGKYTQERTVCRSLLSGL
eukprot:6396998-Amphidinium_carterae.1